MSIQKQLIIDSMYSKKIPIELITFIKEFSFPTTKELQTQRKELLHGEILTAISSEGEKDHGTYTDFIFRSTTYWNKSQFQAAMCNKCGNYVFCETIIKTCIMCDCQ